MTDTVQIETTEQDSRMMFVPLNKLKKSPKNARKVPHSEATVEALAASIEHKGLIQNLVVEAEVKDDRRPAAISLPLARAGGSPICCAPSASRSGRTIPSAAGSTPKTTRPKSRWTRM